MSVGLGEGEEGGVERNAIFQARWERTRTGSWGFGTGSFSTRVEGEAEWLDTLGMVLEKDSW